MRAVCELFIDKQAREKDDDTHTMLVVGEYNGY
jgi:hypothetical protein